MVGFNRYFTALQKQYRERSRRWLLGFAALGFLSPSLPPATAATPVNRPAELSIPDSAISFDLGDLLRGVVRYIQVANISDADEVAIGRQINEMLLAREYQLYRNPYVNQYVDQIGQRLVAASNRRNIPYTFQVVDSNAINAFAVPGGFIYVTTGLLKAADNEAQLASVLAHEIAHVNERHSVKALRQAALAQGVAETAGLDTNTLARIGYQVAVGLPRNRQYEYESDRVGLNILQKAGYAPIAFVQFLNQLQGQPFPPEFLRTHPITENRIQAIQTQLQTGSAYAGRGLDEAVYRNRVSPLL